MAMYVYVRVRVCMYVYTHAWMYVSQKALSEAESNAWSCLHVSASQAFRNEARRPWGRLCPAAALLAVEHRH